MRIAIDAHSVGTQLAGNATYITNLIEALAQIDQQNEYALYVTQPEAYELYSGRWPNFYPRRIILNQSRVARLLLSFNAQLRRHSADIFFVQYNAPPFSPSKVVAAIHDLSFERQPETYRRIDRTQMKITIRHTARRAAHVVTCSEHSRDDILETYDLRPEKVTAIPLAAAEWFRPVTNEAKLAEVRRKYGVDHEFILGVGSVQPRKNLSRLIEAYASLAGKRDVPPLLLVGKKAWLSEGSIMAATKHAVEDKVRFTGFIPEEDLPALYTLSKFFVYPSFFEGFGIPPLEAMQCGSPVITGNRTSLPEVVGDAGLMVDPFDVNAIEIGMEKLLSDSNLCDTLRQKGLERAKSFSWKRTAQMTLDVFEKVFNE